MDLNRIAIDDSKLLEDPALASILRPKRRNLPLRFAVVKELVTILNLGAERRANLERYQDGWRLRFILRLPGGRITRKSIVIYDAATMEWVRDYLSSARRRRGKFKFSVDQAEREAIWQARQAAAGL